MILFIVLIIVVLFMMYYFLVPQFLPIGSSGLVGPAGVSGQKTLGKELATKEACQKPKIFMPKKIVIIREANGGTALNDAGIKRATVIADWASPVKNTSSGTAHEAELMALTGGVPVAAVYSHNPSPSMLATLTAQPTSFQLQIPLIAINDQRNVQSLVEHIYTNPIVKDKAVLIVWQHNCVQELMARLNLVAPFWPDDNMGRVIVVDGDRSNYTIGCEKFDDIIDPTGPVNGKLDTVGCAEPLKFMAQVC